MTKSKKPDFRPNEFVVYPAHGVGKIISIEEQEIAGIHLELFVISFEKDKMTLRVPTHKATEIGMRQLSSPDIVTKALDTLKGKARVKRAMWSRRAQEYEQKINSGDLMAIAEVVRDLHRSDDQRFEVDGANAAADFLKPHGLSDDDIEQVWLSIALHTTPGVPQHLRPTVALVTAGVEMDVLGMDYAAFSSTQREAVVHAHPRGEGFKECIICAFADGLRHRPQTTFGNVKTDVLVDQEPGFKPMNFVEVIRRSPWVS